MRKESILILLFLCFGFLSCDDFGIKSIDTGMYIMLPANIDKNEIKVYIDGKETMLFDKFSIDENKNINKPPKINNNPAPKLYFVLFLDLPNDPT